MSHHNDDNGLDISFFVVVPVEIQLAPILFIAMLPLGLLFSSFAFFADTVANHFILTTIVYYIIALAISALITRLKRIRKFKFADNISNLLIFVFSYLLIYFYFIPRFLLDSAILTWLFALIFLAIIVFLQQCFSRILHPIVNLTICVILFIFAFIVLRNSISSQILLEDIIHIYRIGERGFFSSLIEFLFY